MRLLKRLLKRGLRRGTKPKVIFRYNFRSGVCQCSPEVARGIDWAAATRFLDIQKIEVTDKK